MHPVYQGRRAGHVPISRTLPTLVPAGTRAAAGRWETACHILIPLERVPKSDWRGPHVGLGTAQLVDEGVSGCMETEGRSNAPRHARPTAVPTLWPGRSISSVGAVVCTKWGGRRHGISTR